MPPKSASKKEKPFWWNCEKCQTYLPTGELAKHQAEDCGNVASLGGYVDAGGVYRCRKIEVGGLSIFEEVKLCTDSQRYGLVLVPISVVRRLGLMLGDFVAIKLTKAKDGKKVGTVTRTLWPVEDRHGAKVFFEALDEFNDVSAKELNATVTMLDGRLEDAEEIFLRLEDPTQANLFAKNGKFLLTSLKYQLQGCAIMSNNPLSLTVCNKRFRFLVDHAVTAEGNDLTDQLNKMSLKDRLYVILRTTKLTLLDDSKAAQHGHQQRMYSLANIGGLDTTISELKELLEMAFGMDSKQTTVGPVSRGILLSGVSGVGKTMLVNALATHYHCHVVRINCSEVFSKFYGESEANVSRQFAEVFDVHPKPAIVVVEELHNLCPKSTATDIVKRISQHFLTLLDSLHANVRGNRTVVIGTTDSVENGSELFSMWVGESERAVRDLFRRARQVAPSIIFFDEIDAIGGERSAESGSSVKERVLAQLLTEMDGVSVLKDVRIVAATNRPDLIDRALMRPGRLDRIVYVRLPDAAAREEIFRIKLKTIPTASTVDLAELVRRTAGCSGSEIEAICQEAALKGLESSFDVETIEWEHFEHALGVVRPRTSPELLRLRPRALAADGSEQ
ncbi:AGAP009548-PA [Anopheles gambiae str. PEST]|uniref:AGAP009548-PA n=1 Tax=Anopheles gambiae TaxID=7165 RepID=A7USD2_ANOGA|nr:AGAP009548-PA [Anopheles gambiae str. PEST]